MPNRVITFQQTMCTARWMLYPHFKPWTYFGITEAEWMKNEFSQTGSIDLKTYVIEKIVNFVKSDTNKDLDAMDGEEMEMIVRDYLGFTSHKQFADYLCMTQPTISNYANGKPSLLVAKELHHVRFMFDSCEWSFKPGPYKKTLKDDRMPMESIKGLIEEQTALPHRSIAKVLHYSQTTISKCLQGHMQPRPLLHAWLDRLYNNYYLTI